MGVEFGFVRNIGAEKWDVRPGENSREYPGKSEIGRTFDEECDDEWVHRVARPLYHRGISLKLVALREVN